MRFAHSANKVIKAINNTLLLAVIAIVLLSVNASSQSLSKVLSQAEKAMGGKKALQSVRYIAKTGTIVDVSDGSQGKYSAATAGPNLIHHRYEINGFESELGYNGRSAWTRDSRDGLRTLTGKAGIDLIAHDQRRRQ